MMFEADKVAIIVPELLKQLRPGHHLDPVVLLRYPDLEICVVRHLEQYITNALHYQPSLGGA